MANKSDFRRSNSVSGQNVTNQIIDQIQQQGEPGNDLAGNEDKTDTNEENHTNDQTSLLQNEEESFALAPVNASSLVGVWYFFINRAEEIISYRILLWQVYRRREENVN